jgi:MFS family permease
MASAVIAPVLPRMAANFQNTPHAPLMISLVATSPALFIALLAAPFGLLADRVGRRLLLLIGLAIYGMLGVAPYWLNSLQWIRLLSRRGRRNRSDDHFGAGPRGCIGGNYAMLQILMIRSELLRSDDFQLTPGQTIKARPMVILRPKHGIRMTFTQAIARNRYAIVQE